MTTEALTKLYVARTEGDITAEGFCVGCYLIPYLAKRPRRANYQMIATAVGIKGKTDQAVSRAIGRKISHLIGLGIIGCDDKNITRRLLFLPGQSGFQCKTDRVLMQNKIRTENGQDSDISKPNNGNSAAESSGYTVSDSDNIRTTDGQDSDTSTEVLSTKYCSTKGFSDSMTEFVTQVADHMSKKNETKNKPRVNAFYGGKPTKAGEYIATRIRQIKKDGLPGMPNVAPEDVLPFMLRVVDKAGTDFYINQGNLSSKTVFHWQGNWEKNRDAAMHQWTPPSQREDKPKPEVDENGYVKF